MSAMPAYPRATPKVAQPLTPGESELWSKLREAEAARPAPVQRIWLGEGRRNRMASLQNVLELDSGGRFLHVPWLREPRPSSRQQILFAAAILLTIVVAVGCLVVGIPLFWTVIATLIVFGAMVGVSYRARANDSRRVEPPDGAGGLPGFLCLPDRLVVRYPNAAYVLPREVIGRIVKADRMRQEAMDAMAEYDLVVQVNTPTGPDLTLAEVVDLQGHEGRDSSERMAVILGLAAWLDRVWLFDQPA